MMETDGLPEPDSTREAISEELIAVLRYRHQVGILRTGYQLGWHRGYYRP